MGGDIDADRRQFGHLNTPASDGIGRTGGNFTALQIFKGGDAGLPPRYNDAVEGHGAVGRRRRHQRIETAAQPVGQGKGAGGVKSQVDTARHLGVDQGGKVGKGEDLGRAAERFGNAGAKRLQGAQKGIGFAARNDADPEAARRGHRRRAGRGAGPGRVPAIALAGRGIASGRRRHDHRFKAQAGRRFSCRGVAGGLLRAGGAGRQDCRCQRNGRGERRYRRAAPDPASP